MSDYNLGTARGVIEIEYKGDGPRQAAQDMRNTGTAAKKSSADIDKAARGAGIGGAIIAGGFALAAKSAADFEFRMSAVESVSGATASQMDALKDKALQLGKDTKYSATDAASAMEELVKAGLSVEDVLNGAADSTVALAAAGEIALPEAATIASNAMNQFNLGAEDMVNVADKIAGAANASAIDVSDLGQSMSQVGAVANLAGVSFDDTATAIALMGNAGIKGSDAGTSLKSMLMRLQPTTKAQADEMKRLGLLTEDGTNKFYDAQGNLKSFDKVAGTLKESLKGMTKEQKQATLQTLFGSDAIRAAAVISDKGAKGFRNMTDALGKVSAADVAATRMDNLKGSFEQFTGSVETLAIQVGTPLLGALTSIVNTLTSVLETFMNLPGPLQATIVGFIALVGATLLAFAAFVKIVQFLTAVKAAFIAIRAVAIPAWLAALGPIALVVVAIAAVIAILVILYKKSATFRAIVNAVWNYVKAAWNGIKSSTIAAWNAVMNFIRTTWAKISGNTKSAIANAKAAITNGWTAAKTTTQNLWRGIVNAVTEKIKEIVQQAKSIKDKVTGAISGAKDWLYDKGKEIIQGLIDGILSMVDKVRSTIASVTDKIAGFLPGSPVREGPLKVLNNGYAGKKIVEMVNDGMTIGVRPLGTSLQGLLAVGDVGSGVPTTIVPSEAVLASPRGYPAAAAPGGGSSRLVQGRLSLDDSGRAFITGIAEDVYGGFAGDDGRRGDMQW